MASAVLRSGADPFDRIGNDLSVDFANTIFSKDRAGGSLHSAGDVLAFLIDAAAIDRHKASATRKALARGRGADARLLREALRLRAALRQVLQALDGRKQVPPAALRVVNSVLAADVGFERVEPRPGRRFDIVYRRTRPGALGVLAPVARAASRLLVARRSKIHKCANPACVRYFYDSSRTGGRRWCEMAVCGNRAKAAAFLKRRRTAT